MLYFFPQVIFISIPTRFLFCFQFVRVTLFYTIFTVLPLVIYSTVRSIFQGRQNQKENKFQQYLHKRFLRGKAKPVQGGGTYT